MKTCVHESISPIKLVHAYLALRKIRAARSELAFVVSRADDLVAEAVELIQNPKEPHAEAFAQAVAEVARRCKSKAPLKALLDHPNPKVRASIERALE